MPPPHPCHSSGSGAGSEAEWAAQKNKWLNLLRNQGVVPAQVFAIVLAPFLIREIAVPQIQWGLTPLSFGFVLEHFTIFGLGFPAAKFFISAIPMALTVYIIAFSDFVLAKEVVTEATATRPDETVIFDGRPFQPGKLSP